MAFVTAKQAAERREEALRRAEEARVARIEKFKADPYMGYPTLDAALADAKCSTQAEVMARLLAKENLFISGLAGAGKTTVIKAFFDLIDAEQKGERVMALTASTGIAATLIGGRTVHSWAGLGLGEKPFDPRDRESMARNFWGDTGRRQEIAKTDVLVIDEISMLPAYFFINLDKMLKYVKRNQEPFGGIQLVLTGDFLQLPPVAKQGDQDLDTRFAIETKEWQAANIKYCFMDKSYRATDDRMKTLLREVANGTVSPKTRALVASRVGVEKDPKKIYTTLYTTNAKVDEYNEKRLAQEPTPLRLLRTREEGPAKKVKEAYKKFGLPEALSLKEGAVVIITKNLTYGNIANGSIGRVEGFGSDNDPIVRFNDGTLHTISRVSYDLVERKEVEVPIASSYQDPATNQTKTATKLKKMVSNEVVATLKQYPMKLGYAITVHKSQGQTFDGVEVDLSKCFQDGLGYVALSRVRSFDDLIIKDFNERAYRVSPKSQRITKYVKNLAYKNRLAFEGEEREYYETLLTNPVVRRAMWDTFPQADTTGDLDF